MDGFTRPEPAPGMVCCAGSDLYHPTAQFLLSGRIYTQSLMCPNDSGHISGQWADSGWTISGQDGQD